jgi:NAD(P)-dependent dehydrogenase (short-subunit alcohol dehydrogenase family)
MSNSSKYRSKTVRKHVTEQFSLLDRNIVITGGGGFLGRFFALAMLESNARVILLDSSENGLTENVRYLTDKSHKVMSYCLDLNNEHSVVSIVNEILIKVGSIDVLINAAAFAMQNLSRGGNDYFKKVEEFSSELFEEVNNSNLNINFITTKHIGKKMSEEGSGSIINISSDVGVISPDHRIYEKSNVSNYKGVDFNTPISYSASKAAIISMTRYLATYWALKGVRVNSISPAGVYRGQDDDFVRELEHRIPLGRMAMPEELMGAAIFLASDASSFITGHNLMVDGGRSVW